MVRLGNIASFLLLLAVASSWVGDVVATVQVATAAPAPSPNFPVCYVCGSKDLHVTKPDSVIHFPGQDPITCERLEYGGLNGFINPTYCPLLAAFHIVKICGCKPVEGDDEEEESFISIQQARKVMEFEDAEQDKIDSEVEKEVAALPAPLPDFPICYVCGSNTLSVTKPDNQIKLPGQEEPVSCNKLEYGGLNGFVNPSFCPLLGAFQVAKKCGCAPKGLIEEEQKENNSTLIVRQAAEVKSNEAEDTLPDFPVCYVCGSKKLSVTKPENQINFPGQGEPISCEKLELGGLNGFVNPSFCPLLGAFQVPKTCGCAPKEEDSDVAIREAYEIKDQDGSNGKDSHQQLQGEEVKTEEAQVVKKVQDHSSIAPAPSPGYPICYICGSKNKAVTKPDGEVRFPEVDKPVPCYKLEYGGLNGFISASQCPMLAFFKVPLICGCKEESQEVVSELEEKDEEEAVESVAEDEASVSGTKQTDVATAISNSVESKTKDIEDEAKSLSPGYPVCYICGSKNKAVTKPDSQVSFPGLDKPVPCYKLEYGGLNGFISTTECPMMPFFKVPLNCGCKEASEEVVEALEEEHEEEAIDAVAEVHAEVLGTEGSGQEGEVQVESTNRQDHNESITHKSGEAESYATEPSSTNDGEDTSHNGSQQQKQQHQHVVESPGYPVCHICGSSKLAVTQPHVRVTLPGQRPIRCSKLEFGGLNGYISPDLCPELSVERVPEACGCEPIAWHTNSTLDSEETDNNE